MDKKSLNIYAIAVLVMLCMFAFPFVGLQDRNKDTVGYFRMPASQTVNSEDHDHRYSSAMDLVAGICALLLVAYLFWFFYRKFQTDSQADLTAMEQSLYKISVATGRTEYDLFCKSAGGWSVTSNRIEQDFKRYMSDQVLPYYAKDFVRKNQAHLDESLVNKKEIKPTSWSDWAKALLVFPGSLLLLLSISLFLV